MINGNYKTFVDNLYYGYEMNFSYKDKKFFIEGWRKKGIFKIMLIQFVPWLKDYLWTYESKETSECVKAFLSAKIFDGKTFPEIEKEVEWLDDEPDDIEQETKEYWEKHKDEIPES